MIDKMRRSQRTHSGTTPKNFDKWIAQTRNMARQDIRKKPKTDAPRRKSNRNSARARPSPKNFEEMIEEAENLAIKGIYMEACAKKTKHSGPPFRLFDLPPELCERILGDMVFRPDPLPLKDLVAPLITAISKHVRAECMRLFFELNTFQIVVDTNICLNEHIKAFCQLYGSLRAAKQATNLTLMARFWIDLIYLFDSKAGKIMIRASTKRWLEKIDPSVAVLRNVELLLKDLLNHPMLCALDTTAPIGLQSVWIYEHLNSRRRIVFTMSLWHFTRLSPHFVSYPIDESTATTYYDLPKNRIKDNFNRPLPLYRNFNWNTLQRLAYVVAHYGDW